MESSTTLNLIYSIVFLDLFSVGIIFPVFGQYLRDLGASHTVIGLYSSIYSALQVIAGPIIGSWSDVRDRKTVLKTTLLVSSLCYFSLGQTHSLVVIFLFRVILGMFKHTQSLCKAMITDILPSEDKTGIYAKIVSLASLGFIIGPLIGGNLVEFENGFVYVSCTTSGLFLLNYIIACYLPEGPRKEHIPRSESINIFERVRREFKKTIDQFYEVDWTLYWKPFLLKFLFGFTMACHFSNQGLYLKQTYDLSQKHSGYVISYFSVISIISGFCLKKIDRIWKYNNPSMQMSAWYAVLSISFIGLYFSPNLIAFLLILTPMSIASTAIRVLLMELIFKNSENLHIGSLSGTSNSIMSVARFVTPLFIGVTSDLFNAQSVMLLAAIPATIGMMVSIFLKNKEKTI